tara:strand:- start:4393 stop:5610 length:1218 start_codon:yes stop_codon:yes gene_type:complete
MSSKTILFINHFAGIPKINERNLRHFMIAKDLIGKGYDPVIICSQNHYQMLENGSFPTKEIVKIDGVKYIFINEKNYKKNNLLTKFFKMISFSYGLFKFLFSKKLKIKNIKFVYGSSPDLFTALVGLMYCKKNKLKYVLEIRDIWPLSQIILHGFNKNNFLIRLLAFIEIYIYKNSDIITSPLWNFKEYLDLNSINKNFKYIPQTYYPHKKNVVQQDLKALSKFSKIGIYSGSIGTFYQVEQIINFFPRELSKKIAIIIIGDGDMYNHIKQIVAKRSLNNFFILESANHSKLSSYFKLADFAIATIPEHDLLYKYGLCPLKVYDYMYHKLPVFFIGNKSYLDIDSDGIIACKFDNEKNFKESLIKIHTLSKQELREKGILNYDLVKINNSPKLVSEKFMEILSDI